MASDQKAALRSYQADLAKSRARLDRLLDRRAVVSLKRYYDKAQDDLETRLHKMAKGVNKDPLTPLQVQQLLEQVRLAQRIIAQRLHQQFMPISLEAQQEGIEQIAETVEKQERRAFGGEITLPLGDEAVDQMLIGQRRPQLTNLNEKSYRRFAESVSTAVEAALATALSLEETPADAIDRIRAATEDEWWKSERIIHTEMAVAYNTANTDSIVLLGKQFPGLSKRWCELVDDATGQPLDDRVAQDSMVLHGQITTMSGLFVMPPDNRVSPRVWNLTYFCSPNRPNDRSVTMPWRPGWGVPGYLWKDGQRVPVR